MNFTVLKTALIPKSCDLLFKCLAKLFELEIYLARPLTLYPVARTYYSGCNFSTGCPVYLVTTMYNTIGLALMI